MPRPRKSVEALKRDGTFQKHRHADRNPPKPDPVQKVPAAPDWLTAKQKKIFARKAREMMDVNLLTALDVDTLAVYAALYETISSDITKATGALMSQLRGLSNDLGLNPAARERLSVKPKEKDRNEFDGI